MLKLYGDRRETDAPHGRVALAILIFQDFLIVPMIVLPRCSAARSRRRPASWRGASAAR